LKIDKIYTLYQKVWKLGS